jgi:hypothetical protein
MPLSHGYTENRRGIGVADMAHAIRGGHEHRASGAMAFHVLDTMVAILEAAAAGRSVTIESTCARPEPLRNDLPDGILDPAWLEGAASHG